MERKIGGIFEFKGSKYNDSVKLMVIESDTCEGCYFQLPVYGHCSTKQIYEELLKLGFNIDKKKIIIKNPINTLGYHIIKINLHKKVTLDLKVEIVEK